MTFEEAGAFRLPFGKYKGWTLEETAAIDDAGLFYLDWLAGQDLYGGLRKALDTYLADPAIAGEVELALRKGA